MTERRLSIVIEPKVDGARVVRRSLDDMKNAAFDAEKSVGRLGSAANDNFSKMARSAGITSQAMNVLKSAMTGLLAAFSAHAIKEMVDTFSDLTSRVNNAAGSMVRGAVVMGRIEEMARRTYSSLNQTAESWLSNATALSELGYSLDQQLDLVESLNNAMVISATRGERAASVMNAWSKAMALGRLSGDNLNAVITGSDRLAKALAASMGVTVSQLRNLGAEGKITAAAMFGVTSQLEQLRAEADAMPATLSDAFVIMGNAVLGFVGNLDQAQGASGMLATGIIELADNFDVLVRIMAVGAIAVAARQLGVLSAQTVDYAGKQMATIGASRAAAVAEQQAAVARLRSAEAAMAVARANGQLTTSYAIVSRELLAARVALTAANAQLAATTVQARVATVALAGLSNVLKFFGGWVGLALTAVAVGIGVWATRADEASVALEEHSRIVGELRTAYEEAGASAGDWAARVAEGNMTQAVANLEKLRGELDAIRQQAKAPVDVFGMDTKGTVAALQTVVDQFHAGEISARGFKAEVDRIAQSDPSFARDLANSLLAVGDAANGVEQSVQRAEAVLRVFNGTASQADMIMLGMAGSANAAAAGMNNAAGAAMTYANALQALGQRIPEVAALQQAQTKLEGAQAEFSAGMADLEAQYNAGGMSLDTFAAKHGELKSMLDRAKGEITGLTSATKQLETAERSAFIDSLPARESAAERIRDKYAEIEKSLRSAGAAPEALERAAEAMNLELQNSANSFDQVGAKSGGAAKALKAAEKDFESFIGTADRLAEALFPGEYARREAMELQAALDVYGASLDDFQRRAVEAEIGDLFKAAELGVRRLEDTTKDAARNMGDELKNTLGSILGDLFSKPIEDFDDFIDRVMSGLGQLGQANLSASMDMLFGNGDGLSKAVERGAKAGTEAGSATGLGDWFTNMFGGAGGANGNALMGALGSAAGGLGIGYQTQDPVMGALGGALSGIAGGPIGIVAGALGGFIGGLFGANKALQEAQEKLAKLRGEIDSFLDVGEGRGVGQMTQSFREYWDKSHEYQELAMKAGDAALQKRLQSAVNTFFLQLDKDFRLGFEGTLDALSSGQGMSGPFVSAQQQIVSLREDLKGFIADTEYMGNKLGELASIDNAAEVADNLARARRAAQDYALSVLAGAEAQTDMEKAALEAEGKASALQVTLEQLGMSAEGAATAITSALGMAMAKLRDEYARDINASINDLSGFGFLNEIVEAQAKYQERLRDAAALGLDGASAMQELGLSLAGIARSAGLTQSQIDMLAQTFPAMAGMLETLAGEDTRRMIADAEAALRSAYEARRREIEQTISRLERFAQSIRKFRDDMRLSDSSPLGQRDQTEEALRQFRETAALAAAGDVEAQNRLTSVSQAALDEARAYHASSARYSEIWFEIDRTLADIEDKTGRQLSDAQRQLEALDKQVGALITLNSSVLSVADAIANLAAAQAASDAALAGQLAQLGAANSNSVSEVYKSVLGRDPDADGLAYWNNQMNQGKSLGQVSDQISNSREAQVQQLYQSILGRAADASGLQYWVGSNKAISQIDEELRYMKSMGSYATGGFTGFGGVNDPAGIVHRGEYVFDAAATSRIGVQNLEAMRAGQRVGNDNGDVVAELRALRAENAAIKGELSRIASVIALDGQETRKTIDRGNESTEELASNIKRIVAA